MKIVAWKLINEVSKEFDKKLIEIKNSGCQWVIKRTDLFDMLFVEVGYD